jgi:hypothetical protein
VAGSRSGFLSNGAADSVRAAGLLGLGVFLLCLLSGREIDLLGSTPRIFLVLAWPVVLAAFWLSGRAWLVALYLLGGGLLLRMYDFPAGGGGPSDVLAATHEAIAVLLRGGNPYDHFYELTRPPGSPMPYPPGALLVHLPGYVASGMIGVQATEVVLAGVTMAAFAWLGVRISWLAALPALAVYAAIPNLVVLSLDGSNDTGVGALLVLAILAVMWALERGADVRALLLAGVVGGLAVGTKQTALPIVLLLGLLLWQRHGRPAAARYAAGALGLLLVISLPFLLMDPLAYLRGLTGFLGVHDDVYGWNIWTFVRGIGWTVWEPAPAAALNLLASAFALVVAVAVRYRSLAGAVAGGLLMTLVALLTARWTTYAYFAMIAPVAVLLPLLVLWERRWRSTGESAAEVPTGQPADEPTASQPTVPPWQSTARRPAKGG